MTEDWNGTVGEYTHEEFEQMVTTYRERHCRNNLALYPSCDHLIFFGNKRVVYTDTHVRLEDI